MSLEITTRPLRTFGHVLTLVGSLDSTTFGRLEMEIERLMVLGTPLIVLELSGLSYINSHGIRVVQKGTREMEKAGGALKLLNPQAGVARVFEIIQAPTLTQDFGSLEELDAFLHQVQRPGE